MDAAKTTAGGIGSLLIVAFVVAYWLSLGHGLLGEFGVRENPTIRLTAADLGSASTVREAEALVDARLNAACRPGFGHRVLWGEPDSVTIVAVDVDGSTRHARADCNTGKIETVP